MSGGRRAAGRTGACPCRRSGSRWRAPAAYRDCVSHARFPPRCDRQEGEAETRHRGTPFWTAPSRGSTKRQRLQRVGAVLAEPEPDEKGFMLGVAGALVDLDIAQNLPRAALELQLLVVAAGLESHHLGGRDLLGNETLRRLADLGMGRGRIGRRQEEIERDGRRDQHPENRADENSRETHLSSTLRCKGRACFTAKDATFPLTPNWGEIMANPLRPAWLLPALLLAAGQAAAAADPIADFYHSHPI